MKIKPTEIMVVVGSRAKINDLLFARDLSKLLKGYGYIHGQPVKENKLLIYKFVDEEEEELQKQKNSEEEKLPTNKVKLHPVTVAMKAAMEGVILK